MGFKSAFKLRASRLVLAAALGSPASGIAMAQEPVLLFRASADRDLIADTAGGDAVPNFKSGVKIVPNGASGGAIQWEDDGLVTWTAPGNIYAQRGTLSFFWRSRYPVGEAPFAVFRVGFADHSSWDMAWLRIDWNGHGFDAFVTDANLARTRVSLRLDTLPKPDEWHQIAFAWDETVGVRLYLNGREVARQNRKADYDVGLDQFGLAGRIISPHQVQSRYNFMRGSDVDEIRIYDRMIAPEAVASLAANRTPATAVAVQTDAEHQAWLRRFGWERGSPPVLDAPVTSIRKVEFADARDIKQWMWKGVDGIEETTWPGVYNRSRIAGRDDYFLLPDWNTYVEGGKAYDLTVPANERVNRVEIRGAAYGELLYSPDGTAYRPLGRRADGALRTVHQFTSRTAGKLRFSNAAQEKPIQEIWAYDVDRQPEPAGTFKLSYTVNAEAAPAYGNLSPLVKFIEGRHPADERSIVVALPAGSSAARAAPGAADPAAATPATERKSGNAPLVHILIPPGFSDALPDRAPARAWNYGWENVHDGLDGIAIDLPALKLAAGRDGLIPLNIRVKDPIWPGRDMINVSVSVRPRQARTLWLDLRDRILTADGLYLTIASASPEFGPSSLEGANIRLVFKAREQAKAEHVADRFNQVKDNWGFLVEEHTSSKRQGLYRRLYGDISDLLRVDPDNRLARQYWADISYGSQGWPAPAPEPASAPGVPLWASRQLQDLKLVRRFVNWWIDERQVPYGDFGGGISDDSDLIQQWPGLALMGVDPDKINASVCALSDAAYKNGMMTNGLGTIVTDELHAYEEGINSDAARLYLNWGEPKAIERLMATTRALQNVILRNPAGHMHFASNWYGASKMYREGPWEWQKPYSFTVLHGSGLLGIYNANPAARALVTGVVDGWMAHGKRDAQGNWSFPNDINWRTDAERVGDRGGVNTPLQYAWASYRWSGDEKYLRPLSGRVAENGPAALADVTENAVAVLGSRDDWKKALSAKGGSTTAFDHYLNWARSGDKASLEKLHAAAINSKSQSMYMLTEGHWWSDRVEQPSDILQRERLGGLALRRNFTFPGHTVSWRFADPNGAEQVAILLPGATPERFKVIAYNVSDRPQQATMTGWNVIAGQWRMKSGTNANGDDKADGPLSARSIPLQRSGSVDVSFAPRMATVVEFELEQPTVAAERRPDLGIGIDDVQVRGREVRVTVHSLGSEAVSGGTLVLEDASGRQLATAAIPAMAAPNDLLPKTAQLRLAAPNGFRAAGARVRLALPNDALETTLLNNVVQLR